MDRAHLPPRQGWRVGKPGRPPRIFRPWMDEKRSTGVAFSLVTFSWPRKRKSPARMGCARKKTGMSADCVTSKVTGSRLSPGRQMMDCEFCARASPIRPSGIPCKRGKKQSKQHDIELLLPVLLLGLEADRLPDEGLQLGDGGRFFLQHASDHFR